MTTQRKIHHLLASEGEGRTFRYVPQLAIQFDLHAPILVTEKVDGSTGQAIVGELFKRYDRFSKGDPKKRTVTEEERYELRQCSRTNPAEQWYFAAFDAHREGFEKAARISSATWLYFELLGAKIGARYPNLQPTVRIFDSSTPAVAFDDPKGFRPFEYTKELAEQAGLPVVHSFETVFGSLEDLFQQLRGQRSAITVEGSEPFPSEGWVLRQGELIAKIRVVDLDKMKG